jgi:superfamily II DNA or RNA helicase
VDKEEDKNRTLTDQELLLRHQLNVAHYWRGKAESRAEGVTEDELPSARAELPEKWELLKGIELQDWQIECKRKWFDSGKRGVVKVVTGAGKTILALAVAQELQGKYEPDLRVAIVVPTIVLMGQWYDTILKHSNLPPEAIGRLGGGFGEDLSGDRRVLIAVLASASKLLTDKTRSRSMGKSLLLVVDECHRAGAEKMSNVFNVERAYSLGLSATPEREEVPDSQDEDAAILEGDEEEKFEDTIIGKELGPIIYELTFAQAIERSILPRFEIRHYGLSLDSKEMTVYEKHSREITDLRKELQQSSSRAKGMDGGMLVGWARNMANRPDSKISRRAAEYVKQITLRKQLVYRAKARERAVVQLLRKEFAENPDARAILFHESVDEVMRLFQLLRLEGFAVVPENSKLDEKLRAESIGLFRQGIARVVVSARSLIEGFDVPSADIGIVVASSSSVRQRIQTLGRILRKHKTMMGEQKEAVLHVLYMSNTVDEMIYEKNDWDDVIGAERNLYFMWDPELDKEPIPQNAPPREPLPRESEIEWASIKSGDVYPGRYEGDEYSCDTKGNVTDPKGRMASNPQEVEDLLKSVKGSVGKFRVTPQRRAVLVRVPENNSWTTRFACILKERFNFSKLDEITNASEMNISGLKSGDPYPGATDPHEEFHLKRRTRGTIIAKKVKGGEVFARVGQDATDPDRGEDAARLIQAAQEASSRDGEGIGKFYVNSLNHAFYFLKGQARFLCVIKKGFEFPDMGAKQGG